MTDEELEHRRKDLVTELGQKRSRRHSLDDAELQDAKRKNLDKIPPKAFGTKGACQTTR